MSSIQYPTQAKFDYPKEGINLSSTLNFVQNAYKCSDLSESDEVITGSFKEFSRKR